MLEEDKKIEYTTIYEIENKKYTVITKSIENIQNIDNLYEVICKYVISKLN